MKPHNRKRHHVANYEDEDGCNCFVGNPSQAKEFYETFAPGKKVYIVHNEDNQTCYVEVNL